MDEISGEIIYTLRIASFEYQPGVFEKGTYTVAVGEPGTGSMKSIPGLIPQGSREQDTLLVSFE
jgi:hypothetical protein